jgi:peptide/nickel transport system ATP-binding protein
VLGELTGSPPDLSRLGPGCSFAPRCRERVDLCAEIEPASTGPVAGHRTSCLRIAADA